MLRQNVREREQRHEPGQVEGEKLLDRGRISFRRHELYAPFYHLHHEYQTIARCTSARFLIEASLGPSAGRECPHWGRDSGAPRPRPHGASVAGVAHADRAISNPGGGDRWKAADIVGILGNPRQLATFQEMTLKRPTGRRSHRWPVYRAIRVKKAAKE